MVAELGKWKYLQAFSKFYLQLNAPVKASKALTEAFGVHKAYSDIAATSTGVSVSPQAQPEGRKETPREDVAARDNPPFPPSSLPATSSLKRSSSALNLNTRAGKRRCFLPEPLHVIDVDQFGNDNSKGERPAPDSD